MNDITPIPELDEVREYIRASGVKYDEWARRCGVGYWTVAKFMTSRNPTMQTFATIRSAVDAHKQGMAA